MSLAALLPDRAGAGNHHAPGLHAVLLDDPQVPMRMIWRMLHLTNSFATMLSEGASCRWWNSRPAKRPAAKLEITVQAALIDSRRTSRR